MIIAVASLFFPLAIHFNTLAGEPVTQERKVDNFTKVEVSGAYKVKLTQGSEIKLKVTGDADAQEDLITEVVNGTLKIHRRNSASWKWNNDKNNVDITLTVKDLKSLEASGASRIEGQSTIKAENLKLEVTGASSLSMTIEADKIDADISGAASVRLMGKVKKQDVDVSGAGSYKAFELESQIAEVDASGASKAQISVSDDLEADASGASNIRYKGRPKNSNIESSGGSSVKQAKTATEE